jgi:putative transposase
VKFAFIHIERAHFPLPILCRVLDVSVSGFFDYLARQAEPRADRDAELRPDLITIHQGSRSTYGRPRMVEALRACGHRIGHKRTRRLMGELQLKGVRKGRFRPRTTDSNHRRPIAANVLDRRFAVDADVNAWVSDITYIPTRDRWLYLAIVLALRTRQVVGYCLDERMTDDLVLRAFDNACSSTSTTIGTLHHSDQGSQYASDDFARTLKTQGFVQSMSRKGNCWDNAAAESFFATLKAEEVTQPYETSADAHREIAGYIHGFYNPVRLHSTLGYLSPNAYAQRLQTEN